MTFRIPSGKHYSRPWCLGIWWDRKTFAWKVRFTDSCRYDLKSDDQYDTNKLCGVGYFPGFHHKDSARFGWRYWPATGWVELIAYCYVDGGRIIKNLAFCEIGKEYHLQLNCAEHNYIFNVVDPVFDKPVGGISVAHAHTKKLGYGLYPYFGGNQVALHEMEINLSTLG